MGFNYKKSVQALNYIANVNGGSCNIMQAIKLIWLADRLHLRTYARVITNDSYFALPYGPVPSITFDILKENRNLDPIFLEYSSGFLEKNGEYTFKSISAPNLRVFSDTDLECLELILEKFGKFTWDELSYLSHSFPEWLRFKDKIENSANKSFRMDISDFFINYLEPSGLFNDNEEDIKIVKDVYNEVEYLD